MSNPETLEDYKSWCREFLNVDFDDEASKNRYEINILNAHLAANNHSFFQLLDRKLEECSDSYEQMTNSELFISPVNFKLVQKTYDSAVDKSFRTNILWNDNFPEEPKKGWVTPINLHSYFNDAVRGYLICRFIDGPRFIAKQLGKYAKSLGLKSRFYSQEREEGYYAYHFYVTIEVPFLDESFKKVNSQIEIEIQLTTQLQEVLKELTHQFYQVNRLRSDNNSKWKWNYKTNGFKLSYVSHTLHLLESIIIEIRDNKTDVNQLNED
ncbi:MAG: hypothetical protein WBA07_32210 [Rivularia sp. (in: cyanobacteria)]